MFSTPRRFIKTGIAFLAISLLLGAWTLLNRELRGIAPHPYLVSAHVHAVGIGFVMFVILGVAQWLFPRPAKDDQRYRPARIEAAYWLLASSTLLRIAAEVGRVWSDSVWLRYSVLLTGLGQILGLAVYFYAMWGRIRPVGSALREAAGERF